MNKSIRRQKGGLCNGCGAADSCITYKDADGFRWCPWCAHRIGHITEESLHRDAHEEMLLRVGMKGSKPHASPLSDQSKAMRQDLLATLLGRVKHG